MRRLIDHQIVTVDLDDRGRFDCIVGLARSPVATLIPLAELTADLQDGLTPGGLGFLTFDHRGSPIALRGVARAVHGGEAVEFVVTDGVEITERRRAPRLAIRMSLRATPVAQRGTPDAPVQTETENVSLAGALIADHPDLGDGPWRIELALAGGGDPLRCVGAIARRADGRLAIRFTEIAEADLVRLGGVLADRARTAV
ncbi:MAG: PilZ domain-containing protein [Solirubrobacteraceae bacterium]|jgi:hypothetical protein